MKTANKNKSKLSLNLTAPVVGYALERASARFEGNVSRYVRSLIQRDMKKAKVVA